MSRTEYPASDVVTLIPAYNPRSEDLRNTLLSILSQTFSCDVCLIDDGSAIPVTSPIDDPRISIVRLEQNGGITTALRAGVDHAIANNYKYVARLDVGDLSCPDRIRSQREFMDRHEKIDLVGAKSRIVDTLGREHYVFGVSGQERIRRYLFQNPAFRHSTFFFRADALKKFGSYDPEFNDAEDYEIMLRFSKLGSIDCLDKTLIDYVDDPNGLSHTRRKRQLRRRLKCQLRYARPNAALWYIGIARTLLLMHIPAKWIKRTAQRKEKVRAAEEQNA